MLVRIITVRHEVQVHTSPNEACPETMWPACVSLRSNLAFVTLNYILQTCD